MQQVSSTNFFTNILSQSRIGDNLLGGEVIFMNSQNCNDTGSYYGKKAVITESFLRSLKTDKNSPLTGINF